MRTRTINLYSFAELSDSAKQNALDRLRDINVDDSCWSDSAIDAIEDSGALLGISIKHVYFTGFSRQGDGACFEGTYSYRKGALASVRAEWPQEIELHHIASTLQSIQRPHFYRLSATVSHRGHYYHSYCTQIDVEDSNGLNVPARVKDSLKTALRRFMDWSYRCLEREYEYQTSDEAILETIEANEYDFSESGALL
jgi:hypothetical protein